MYEDCIIKKQIITPIECQELSEYFAKREKDFTSIGVKGYGKNRKQFLTIDMQGNKTEWFEKVCEYQTRIAKSFNINEFENGYSWVSLFFPPCDLPMHVDPPIKDFVRLIALLQKPEVGGDVIICKTKYKNEMIIPLEIGDVYRLPAHKYYHSVSFFNEGKPRIAMGFDFKVKGNLCLD